MSVHLRGHEILEMTGAVCAAAVIGGMIAFALAEVVLVVVQIFDY